MEKTAQKSLRLMEPRVLGSGGPAEIPTDGSWLIKAKAAFWSKRDGDAAHNDELILALLNMLHDLFGGSVSIETSLVHEPSVVLLPQGVRFGIHEHVEQDGMGYGLRYLRLSVFVVCQFCERDNEREFETLEELGEILCEPTGTCAHCNKPLRAAGAGG